jgi:hypothetical protein
MSRIWAWLNLARLSSFTATRHTCTSHTAFATYHTSINTPDDPGPLKGEEIKEERPRTIEEKPTTDWPQNSDSMHTIELSCLTHDFSSRDKMYTEHIPNETYDHFHKTDYNTIIYEENQFFLCFLVFTDDKYVLEVGNEREAWLIN